MDQINMTYEPTGSEKCYLSHKMRNLDLEINSQFWLEKAQILGRQTKGGNNLSGDLQRLTTHQGNIVDEVHTGFIGPYVRQLLEGTEFHTSCIASIPSLQAEVMGAW
jgi:hypothetical protein